MFDINNFLMKTIKGMIGNYPDFQVREYAINWYAKGKLVEEDLAEIDTMIEAQYVEPKAEVTETESEEVPEEVEDEDEVEEGISEEVAET